MWKRVIGYTVLVIVILVGGAASYLFLRKPAMAPPSSIKVDMTDARIERGRYIFTLSDCDGCHSEHDTTKLYMPVVLGSRGKGEVFPAADMPGQVVVPNITPDKETGIGNWTDGEKIRAIREGVDKDGKALFPLMPYEQFRHMSDDDVQSLVAYLNSLPAIRNPLPPTQLNFPIPLMIKGAPQPVTSPVPTPDKANRRVYAEYLATLGLCEVCHTPFDKGSFDMSKHYAGGRTFKTTFGTVVSANITPDKDTGIGNWTLPYFLERFSQKKELADSGLPAAEPAKFTIMPWLNLASLPKEDLEALYGYLQELRPVVNKVETHPGFASAPAK